MMEAEGDDSSAGVPQQEEASRRQAKPGGGAFWQHAGLCCFKAKQRTQITAIEYKLKKRQKQFGIDYLTLVENKAGQQELKRCLRHAMDEIEELQVEIDQLVEEIEGREDQVREAVASSKHGSERSERQDDDDANQNNQSKAKKKKSKTVDAEPAFTIDSDDDEDYGQDEKQQDQAPASSKKKKSKKTKKKKKPAQ
ncbi:MAG: hypothetical protein SGILL_006626 [Bacillariaceae sp.]